MGCCVSSDNQDFHEERKRRQSEQPYHKTYMLSHSPALYTSMGVGMGVAMMMQQAGAIVGAAAPTIDANALQAQIRKAKAEGRTVTMVNGCLYFDYQLVARIPPNCDLRV